MIRDSRHERQKETSVIREVWEESNIKTGNHKTGKEKHIEIDGLPVQIEYRAVKNINLYIQPPEGRILVTASSKTPDKRIIDFIKSKETWIQKHRQRIQNAQKIHEDDSLDVARLKERLRHMEQIIPILAQKWEPVMGVHATHWTIREMKTRWGSCTVNTGRIRLNARLAAYPDECLEYVMVHELCHLLEPSHNERFKQYMTKFLPDWKERKQLLNS